MNNKCMSTISLWLMIGWCISGLAAQGEPLTVIAFSDPLRCYGDTNGELSWEIDGGTAPYNYEWSRQTNSFVFAAGSQDMAGVFGPITGALEANIYVLNVTDAEGTIVTTTVEVIAPDPILVTAIEVEPLSCGNLCDGAILMEVGGGTGILTINWPDDPEITSTNRNNLCAGEYLFQLIDEQGCSQKGIVPIEGPAPLVLTAVAAPTSCQGASNGNVSVEMSGGTGAYSYEWSTGSNDATLENTAADDYGLTVTDDNNCILDTILNIPDGPELLANSQIGYGCGDGRIFVAPQPINGTAPYSYQWSTGQQSPYLYGASAGVYDLTLTDAEGCIAFDVINVDYVAPLVVTSYVADVSCFGMQDGGVVLEINGGMPPFDINWESGQVGMVAANLSGGEYTYNITAPGCGEARSITVYEPAEIGADIYYELQTNGLFTASAIVYGGTPPYQLSWSNGASTADVFDLNPVQTYQLSVIDAASCTSEWEVQPALTATEELTRGEFSIFPNPHSGIFQIKAPANTTISGYRIFSATGQLMQDWREISFSGTVDISAYPNGVYLLQLSINEEMETVRMVKF